MQMGFTVNRARKLARNIRVILSWLMLYLTVTGIAGFSCFILEESIQTVMFGTWAAKDAKNWPHVLRGTDLAERFRQHMVIVNWTLGWINPFGFVSYRDYGEASEYWIQATRLQVLANDPQSMEGRMVEFEFTPQTISQDANQIILRNGRILVPVSQMPERLPAHVRGVVQRVPPDGVRIEQENSLSEVEGGRR